MALSEDPPGASPARWSGPAALGLLLALLVAWTFRKWADVHIDFGGELYVPWRLAEGDVLYRDIAYRHGPLSPYLNALWFRLFGISLTTLVVANLAVLVAIAVLLFRLFDRACDRTTATLCVAVMLCVFAFGQYGMIGNYNYVTPYQHHQTHGLVLSLALLACLDAAARRGALRWLALGGLCLGGVFLTKAELFVPALALAAAAFAARALGVWRTPAGAAREIAVFAGGALVPVAAFAAALSLAMPASQAVAGVAGNWAHLSGVVADPFYRRNMGLNHPLESVWRLLGAAGWIAAGAGLLYGLDRVGSRLVAAPLLRGAVAVLLFAALAWAPLPWWKLAPALPAVAVAAVLGLAAGVSRARDEAVRRRRYPLLLFAVYAVVLLGKILLAARFDWYGFVLAMPATLLLVAGLVHGLPAWLRRQHGGGGLARALSIALVAAACVGLLAVSRQHYAERRFAVGSGGDTLLARPPERSPRAALLARTLADLEGRMAPGETLLVLPEGVQLNYWLRVRNPSRFQLFLPTEIEAFGEAAMLADLEAHPPDYVVLVHRGWQEFGTGPFGRDPRNGRRLLAWVEAHYRRVARYGAEPFGSGGFGTVVLERADEAR